MLPAAALREMEGNVADAMGHDALQQRFLGDDFVPADFEPVERTAVQAPAQKAVLPLRKYVCVVECQADLLLQRRMGFPDAVELRDFGDDIARSAVIARLDLVFLRIEIFLPAR